ncbi:hypothetical protein MAR_009701 [Mya arenaria]|uniref:Uncharacterized protein n=1 Tax=Mya arenaria TaxID=6604 RepID=A0ABY7E2X2_MYAAR|nr:uncharacterized protein LOC128232396 isoform X1 [Mya arenaria]WAR03143.1 hypothetical protein MAR_009701 [Mya arenaria]
MSDEENPTNTPVSDDEGQEEEDDLHAELVPSEATSTDDRFDVIDTPKSSRAGIDIDVIDDVLMSEQEIKELDRRLEEVVDRLQKQKGDYEKWESDINTRKLRAFARLKALERCHRKRLEVYETMKDYVQNSQTRVGNT